MSVRYLLLLLFTFLLPLIFWPRSTSYEASKLTLMAVTASLLIAIYARQVRRRRELTLRLSWISLSGLALLAVGLATLPWALNPLLALQAVLLLAVWLVIAATYSLEITSRRHLAGLIAAAVLGCGCAAVYGLLQIAHVLPGAYDAVTHPGISSLGNQNYLAGLLAVVCFPSLVLWGRSRVMVRILAMLASTFLFVAVWLTGAMGPILAVILVAILLAGALALVARERSRLVPHWYGLCLALGMILLVVGGTLALARPAHLPDGSRGRPNPVRRLYNSNSGDSRLTDWAVGLKMLQARPLTGVGLNNYKVGWPRYRAQLVRRPDGPDWAAHEPRATKAHNEYVQFVTETGVAGALIFLAGSIVVLIHWRRRFLQLDQKRKQLDFLFLLTGVSVAAAHAMVSFPLHLPATTGLLALLVGALESRYFTPETSAADRADRADREFRLRWHPALSGLLMLAAVGLAVGALREFRADLQQRHGVEAFRAGDYRTARDLLTGATRARLWPGDGLFYLAVTRKATGGQAGRESAGITNATAAADVIMAPLLASLRHEPTFEAYLQLAEELRDRHRFAEALAYLTLVDRCEPTERLRRESWFLRATIFLRQGDTEGARTLLEGLLASAPAYYRAWIASGYLEALAGNDQVARRHYQHALDIIDRRIADFKGRPAVEVAGPLNRLQQERATAVRALASLTPDGM